MSVEKVKLTSELVEAFAGTFLSTRYDNPKPTPQFHREAWKLYTSDHTSCMVIAPRDHAKSTALTFDYILAEVCFRTSDYVILIGSTEQKAAEQLSNISDELHINEDLREEFGIASFDTDQVTDIIVSCQDGHRFRILARGAEQKIRGALWNGKKPNLIVGDDMEDDEQVESIDRRRKFRKWFFRAAKQALSRTGKIRVHGTVLHEDSLLSRLKKNRVWKHLFYKAHKSYDDFTEMLWAERWSKEELKLKRLEFEDDGDPGGYAQEFLNDPRDMSDSYLKKEQFIPMTEEDLEVDKLFYIGCDFAVSKNDLANRSSFTVGGRSLDNLVHIVDQHVDRWDSLEWISEMFFIELKWKPQLWFIEGGVIWKAVSPMIYQEMNGATRSPSLVELYGKKDIYLNLEVLNPVKDKAARGRSWQKRMKARMCRFNKEEEWFFPYMDECLSFTGGRQAKADDQFDSTATLFLGLDKLGSIEESDFEEYPEEDEDLSYKRYSQVSRNNQTGY